MTPQKAQDIYHDACMAEYHQHRAEYNPVNQRKVVMAGFQAVIDAVTKELDTQYAEQHLRMGKT